jgi:hypothetical protein
MRVAVKGFGSIWTRRFGKDCDSRTRFTGEAAFYNTTGVLVGNAFRARSRVYGVARFNGASGFTPYDPARVLNRVFECEEPETWNGGNRLLFQRLASEPVQPDRYLVTLHESVMGWIDRSGTWTAPECFLLSFSESDLHQKAMLLMPAFTWVRGSAGVFVLEPEANRSWMARLTCRVDETRRG